MRGKGELRGKERGEEEEKVGERRGVEGRREEREERGGEGKGGEGRGEKTAQTHTSGGPLTSRLLKDLQGLGVDLLSAPQFRVQSVHLDQAEVGTKVHEQADEGS